MSKRKIRILIVDDHAIMREGLKRILADEPEMQVAGEAANGDEALGMVRDGEWGVVLLDIALPGKSGLDILKHIKAAQPALPVLILSMYPEDQYAVRVLKSGAAGYLTKESAPGQLVAAIRKVAQGGIYVSQELAEKLAIELHSAPEKSPHETLSDREFEILRLIGAGRTPGQIAAELHLSIKTISTYRARLLQKMRMRTNAELTHYAVKNGLVI